jgi:hypothetical protein
MISSPSTPSVVQQNIGRGQVQLSEGAALIDASREDEDAAHFNGQDLQERRPLFEIEELCIHSLGTLDASVLLGKSSTSTQVTQNDIVVLTDQPGTWQVVALVNGNKADIRRREGFDTRVVTAVLESLTVVQYATSPGCSY